jgi:uroporphyrinogen-III synthase
MRVLITRPQPDGERTAAAVRAKGHDVLLAPLMKVKPVEADITGDWSAVIVTSANALRALTPAQLAPLRTRPLFAVAERSALDAREAGFTDVRSANGDAADLIRLIVERYARQKAPHLYLAGEDRASDVEGTLRAHGIPVHTFVVYRNITTGYPPELVRALDAGTLDAVLHFSRRSSENFLAGGKDAGVLPRAVALRHICISVPVAEPLAAAGAVEIAVARRPDEAAMLALLT